MTVWIVNATTRLVGGVCSFLYGVSVFLYVTLWDTSLVLLNLLTPSRKAGHVVPSPHAGCNLSWPPFTPPSPTDSRSCCPALNAMANHGILPHSGKNIPYPVLSHAIRATFNFAPSFCFFVPWYMARILGREYARDTIDLGDVSVHNGIEHDASLTRRDAGVDKDQARPALELIEDMLAHATGPGGTITAADMARASSKRRREARASNSAFTLSTFHKLFGSSKYVPFPFPSLFFFSFSCR